MRKITCLLLLLCLLPSFALADKTITLTFTGDITLGGEDYLRTAEDSFFAVYEREGAGYFLKNFADFFAEGDSPVVRHDRIGYRPLRFRPPRRLPHWCRDSGG